jgi:hypothetical protein
VDADRDRSQAAFAGDRVLPVAQSEQRLSPDSPPALEPLLPSRHIERTVAGRRRNQLIIIKEQHGVLRRISSRQTKRNAAKSVAEAGEVVRRWASIAFQAGRPDR